MIGLLDSIKEIGIVPLLIPITALVMLVIYLLIVIRTKKKQPAIDEPSKEAYSPRKTTDELTSYVKGQLLTLLEHIDQEMSKEDYHIIEEYLKTLEQNFLLVLFGEFNTGKSSFINAFLGEEILTTGITPTTATINKISHGETTRHELVFHDGATEAVADDAVLSAYTDDQEKMRAIAYMRSFYPSNKLAGLDIIDTPGLNSLFAYHEEQALNFVHKADAVLWMFHPHQGGSGSEKAYLTKIKEYGKSIIAVVSHKDTVEEDQDIADLTDFIRNNFGEFIDQVFVVSSRQALQSIASGDKKGYLESGIAQVEEYLSQSIFDRIKRAKVESAIASCQKSASRSSEVMSETLKELKGIKRFWDRVVQVLSKEALEMDHEIYRRVLESVRSHFDGLREFAREKIGQIFSLRKVSYALLFRKGEVRFPIDEEFLGKLDRPGLESSIGVIVEDLKIGKNRALKKLKMDLMIENRKRRKHGKKLLGIQEIAFEDLVFEDSFVNSQRKDGFVFPEEATPDAISTHLSFKAACGSMGRSVSDAKEGLEKKVSAWISDWERTYITRVIDGLMRINRETRNSLIEHLAPDVLQGAKDPTELRDTIHSMERKIRKIDSIADDLKRLDTR